MMYVDICFTIYFINTLINFLLFNRFYQNVDIVKDYIKYKKKEDSQENRLKYYKWINRYLTIMIFLPVYNTYVWFELFGRLIFKLVKHINNK